MNGVGGASDRRWLDRHDWLRYLNKKRSERTLIQNLPSLSGRSPILSVVTVTFLSGESYETQQPPERLCEDTGRHSAESLPNRNMAWLTV